MMRPIAVALALVCAGCRMAPVPAVPLTLQDRPIPNPPAAAAHRAAASSPVQGKIDDLIGAARQLRDSIERGDKPRAP